ncbi:MAG: electron transfer flavoprotein subunit alpha/FixB family protein [Anaerolineales bacterium]|nr:electron transfer flavoprotein subunit alpha/FixB family protein [Anaerolineales bacterium]
MSHKTWVFIEQFRGVVAPAALEALGEARRVAAALGGGVTALLFGQGVVGLAPQVIAHGADEVLAADDATLAEFRAEPYAALLTKLAGERQPELILAAATTRGRDLLGMAAVDLNGAAFADVTAVHVEGQAISAMRPVYAGKLMANVAAARRPVLMTLRPRAFPLPEPDAARTGAVEKVAAVMAEDAIATKVVEYAVETGRVSLTEARIIVSGGRGVGGPEGFGPVRELAEVLGGAVGASRAAVDAGWIPYAHQVGQTGKTVSPDLYIAVGISGAIQHQAGMRSAKTIVAITKDPEAPIFKLAQYGIVGDLFAIVPALTAEFRKRLGK